MEVNKNQQNNSNHSKYIGKFRFDTENNKCWWLKENGEEYEVPKENKGMGHIAYQNYFILEKENNPSHWVNYQITHSGGKLWVNSWYKKVVGDNTNQYKVKAEKLVNIIEVEFKEEDEMVKEWSERKQKEVWVKKDKVLSDKTKNISVKQKKSLDEDDKIKKEIDEINDL